MILGEETDGDFDLHFGEAVAVSMSVSFLPSDDWFAV